MIVQLKMCTTGKIFRDVCSGNRLAMSEQEYIYIYIYIYIYNIYIYNIYIYNIYIYINIHIHIFYNIWILLKTWSQKFGCTITLVTFVYILRIVMLLGSINKD